MIGEEFKSKANFLNQMNRAAFDNLFRVARFCYRKSSFFNQSSIISHFLGCKNNPIIKKNSESIGHVHLVRGYSILIKYISSLKQVSSCLKYSQHFSSSKLHNAKSVKHCSKKIPPPMSTDTNEKKNQSLIKMTNSKRTTFTVKYKISPMKPTVLQPNEVAKHEITVSLHLLHTSIVLVFYIHVSC